MTDLKRITLALVGSPNSGKTAFFNAFTGSQRKSTNYPGVTIDISTGTALANKHVFHCVDLPGLYSFNAQSFDESITRDYIFDTTGKTVLFEAYSAEKPAIEIRPVGLPIEPTEILFEAYSAEPPVWEVTPI